MSQKEFDNIMRMAGKADDVILDAGKISKNIGNGHAFTKHIEEFKTIWIKTSKQLENHIKGIIQKSKGTLNSKSWARGRSAYRDDDTWTIVIVDPNHIDWWTAFIPSAWKKYFESFE